MGLSPVVSIRLKFVCADRDRHDNVRYYVRLPGRRKVRLKGPPGSHEFMAEYHAALAGNDVNGPAAARVVVGSFGATCLAYYASYQFKALDRSTQAWRRRLLDEICREHGHKPVVRMEPRHVRQLVYALGERPAVANKLLKALRAVFSWAVDTELVEHNPTRDLKPIRYRSDGFHSWTREEIAQYEIRHPTGTKARLALALLLYTAGRREDVVRFGRQHLREGRVRYTQAKNEHRNPVHIDIPIHPDLAAVIDATPVPHLTFLVTEHGKPFSVAGFGNRFREWCDLAGLPHCTAHGLRKATAARLAECGATEHEIMAVTGHRTLKEVERYTRAARRAGLADSGMAKLKK